MILRLLTKKKTTKRKKEKKPTEIYLDISLPQSGSQENDLDADEDYAECLNREDPSHSTTPATETVEPSERNIHGLSVR
jgi:hypothetical protein